MQRIYTDRKIFFLNIRTPESARILIPNGTQLNLGKPF